MIELLCLCQQYDLKGLFGAGFDGLADIHPVTPDEVSDPASIRHVLAFRPLDDAFDAFPNIELVCSVGAGVDGLLRHPGLRADMKIVRMVNPEQAEMMAGFASYYVVGHHRGMWAFPEAQRAKVWKSGFRNTVPSTFPVAVLGYGAMGQAIGRALRAMGYPVTGWASSKRVVDGVKVLSGPEGLRAAVENAQAVIGVLPLTEATHHIFNARTFAMMREDAILIQIGRGDHLNEEDLLQALDQGRPEVAALDVMATEPLPQDSPLWDHPKVMLTPHVASDSAPEDIARAVASSIRAHEAGEIPAGLVDRNRGY